MIVCPSTPRRPGLLGRLGDLLLEVVHVGVGRGARLGSSRARPAACRCGRTPARPSWPRPGRCTSAASPSARGRLPSPRNSTIGAWVCVLISPGSTIWPVASMVCAAGNSAAIAAGVSTADDVGAVDGDRARREHAPAAVHVTTVPLVMTSETGAAPPAAQAERGRRATTVQRRDARARPIRTSCGTAVIV